MYKTCIPGLSDLIKLPSCFGQDGLESEGNKQNSQTVADPEHPPSGQAGAQTRRIPGCRSDEEF